MTVTQQDIRLFEESKVWIAVRDAIDQQTAALQALRDNPSCPHHMQQYYLGQQYALRFIDEQVNAIKNNVEKP